MLIFAAARVVFPSQAELHFFTAAAAFHLRYEGSY
jgi:hypothetical protein